MVKITVVNGIIKMKSIMKIGRKSDNYGRNMTKTRGK
jgi:hypothetical protein